LVFTASILVFLCARLSMLRYATDPILDKPRHDHCFAAVPVAALACAAVVLIAGCASIRSQQATKGAGQPGEVSQAAHFTDIVPPKLELPDWEAPRIDLTSLSSEKRVPSNDRDWIPELKVLASADFNGDKVRLRNVRNAQFFSYRDCLVEYYDKTYDLSQIKSVDFIMIPFNDNRAIAHTLLSFGFENGDYVGVSAEVRLEKGEAYDAATGLFNEFELMYVVADERDLLPVRAQYRNVDVLLYRTTATPQQARTLFVDVLKRVNHLREHPEFYDTLSNNCTTNIVRHNNALAPDRIPYDYRVLLPGYADSLAYELGLIDNSRPFADVRRAARINDLILRYKDDPHFSQRIRGERIQ
jgi:hypothetical protein